MLLLFKTTVNTVYKQLSIINSLILSLLLSVNTIFTIFNAINSKYVWNGVVGHKIWIIIFEIIVLFLLIILIIFLLAVVREDLPLIIVRMVFVWV